MRLDTLFAPNRVKRYKNKLIAVIGLTLINSMSQAALTCPSTNATAVNNTGNTGHCNCCESQNFSVATNNQNINTDAPINILSGNKFRQEQDIKPQDVSQTIGLEYTRYYNSQSNYRNVLGYGWRSSYDIQLLDTTNNIQISQNDGSQLFFYPNNKKLANGLSQTIYIANNRNYGTITKSNINGYPTWQWQQPNGQTFEFTTDSRYLRPNNTLGKLDRIISNHDQPNSDYLALHYDNQQRLIQVQDSRGRQLNISYRTTQYNLPFINVQSPQGTYQYFLDKQGNLSQVVSPTGDRTAYYYQDPNDPHNLTQKLLYPANNPKQPQLLGQWQYDNHDRVIYESLADGKQAIKLQYDATAPLTKAASLNENGSKIYTNILTNALGQTTTYHYKILHGNYRTVDVSGAGCQSCGNTTAPTQLDNKGNLIQRTVGDTTYFYSYDEQSRLTRIELKTKDGTKQWLQSKQYQGESVAPTLITQPSVVAGKQVTTKISYNQYQQPVQIVQQGYTPATANTPEQLITRQINYRYGLINGASKLISIDGVLPGNADTINYQYNINGQLIQINYPEGLTQQFSYDSAGRVSHFKDLDGVATDYLYDAQGQVIQTTKAGKVSKIAYDAQGRLRQLVDPLGQTLNYQYNHAGELSQVSDGKLAQINLIRDLDGNLTQADLLVNGKVEQYINTPQQKNSSALSLYDEPEPPLPTKVIKDKDGRDTVAYFDDFGRIVGEKSPTTGWTAYQWDNDDHLTQVTNGLGQTITTTYDSYGRKILVQTNKEKISFNWNNKNQLKAIQSNHYRINYQYDEQNNLIASDWQLDDKKFSIHREYDANGNIIKKILPSGIQINYSYDNTGKLTKITREKLLFNSVIASNLADENPFDNKIEFKLGNDLTQTDSYKKDGTIDFVGNQKIAYSQSQPYKDGYVISYANAGNHNHDMASNSNINNQSDSKNVTQYPSMQDSYNTIGQLIKDNQHQFVYDEFGRLTEIYDLNHHLLAQYDYLITGERYKKSIFKDGKPVQTIYYIYEENLLTGEYNALDIKQNKEYLYYGVQPIAMLNKDNSYFLTTDHRNAVIAVTNDDKDIVWQGDIQANGSVNAINSHIEMNLRGSNQYYDTESGLHYNINRYFSPSRNQYLTPDPVGLAVGDDLYAFAFNRPHEFVDLDGLAPEYEWYKNNKEAIIGTTVHSIVANYLRLLDPINGGWGGGDSRKRFDAYTWPTGVGKKGGGKLMPDAYYVDTYNRLQERYGNNFQGKIWELKPISWMYDKNKYNYQRALNQIGDYIDPQQVKKGCWSAGSSKEIVKEINNLNNKKIETLGKSYTITFISDPKSDSSGLFFYSYKEDQSQNQENKLRNADLPAISTVPKNSSWWNQLEDIKDGFVSQAKSLGLGTFEILGILLLIAIAFMLIKNPQAIGMLILMFLTALNAARGSDSSGQPIKKVPLLEALGVALGIDNLSKEYLIQKGKEYAAKQWDKVTKWAGDWFK